MNIRSSGRSPAVIFAILVALPVAAQGPLNPPGPPAPMMKTLQQIEPRIDVMTLPGDAGAHHVIERPGSYYVSANLAVTLGTGIRINASNVTLDLGGFVISGAADNSSYGILIGTTAARAVIRAGTIEAMGTGIGQLLIGPLAGTSATVEETVIANSISAGLALPGNGVTVRRCEFTGHQAVTARCGPGAVFESCTVHDNAGDAVLVDLGAGSRVSGCVFASNKAASAIAAGAGTIIEDSTVREGEFGAAAVVVTDGAVVRRCALTRNSSVGPTLQVGPRSRVSEATISDNAVTGAGASALDAGPGSAVHGTAASANRLGPAPSAGISGGDGSSIIDCVAIGNQPQPPGPIGGATLAMGIAVADGATVKNCVSRRNAGSGIYCGSECLIFGNVASANIGTALGGGGGFHVAGNDNRVEGNLSNGNGSGYFVAGMTNLIVRNSGAGNGVNWIIVAGNDVAPIVVSPPSPAIAGNAGGIGIGQLDPAGNTTQ